MSEYPVLSRTSSYVTANPLTANISKKPSHFRIPTPFSPFFTGLFICKGASNTLTLKHQKAADKRTTSYIFYMTKPNDILYTREMKITSATFMRGLSGTDDILEDGVPQVAFIGRSNVGKSSVINSLTGQEGLARTSSFPGRTQEINVFLINKSLYLLDLPGYGYAQASREGRERLQKLIYWYLFDSPYRQKKVVLIIDANVGPTKDDLAMLRGLIDHHKDIVIVANKVDKIKKSEYESKFQALRDAIGNHAIVPYSAKKEIGISDLADEILK